MVCTEKLLEGFAGVLFVCAADFGLSSEECLVCVVEESRVTFSCGEGLVLSAGIGGSTRKVKIGAGDGASATGEFGACSKQKCGDVLCFREVGAVAESDWVAVTEDDKSVTEGAAEEAGVKDGP